MVATSSPMVGGYSRDITIHELFEHQSSESPIRTALSSASGVVGYGELNLLVNRLSHRMRKLGVGRGTLIGHCEVRSPDLIVGMLAILKAGGAYVPLDPDHPDDRLSYMLRDTGLSVIVAHRPTSCRVASLPPGADTLIVNYDDGAMESEEGMDPKCGTGAGDLAYVMYTSGSTGTPKGVTVGHRAVVRLVLGTDYCNFAEDEVFLQLAPASFDASTFEIWGPLLNGARLDIMPPGPLALNILADAVVRQGGTTLWIPETRRICHEIARGNHARVTRLPNGRCSIDGKQWLAGLAADAGRRGPTKTAFVRENVQASTP